MIKKPNTQGPLTFRKKEPRKKKKLKKPWTVKKFIFMSLFFLGLFSLVAVFIGAGAIYFYYSGDLPDVRTLKDYQPSTITRLYSDNDELIAEFYVEKRIIVPLSDIPLHLKQATLAVEDSNFYSHYGVDPKAILRAAITNFRAGHVVEGASTITQQLTKTMFLTRKKSLERKIREAILAMRIELIFTKDEILEMYFNQIYYGHGSYGVEAAALTYFGKRAKNLTLEECALIAGLPKAPNRYSPYRNPDLAEKRRSHSLKRMAALGFIQQSEASVAMNTKFKLGGVSDMLNLAPYFVEHIRQFLEKKYGSTKIYHEGLKVFTTLNLKDQQIAQQAVKTNLRVADKRYGYRGPIDHIDNYNSPSTSDYIKSLNEYEKGEYPLTGDIVKGVVTGITDTDALVNLGDREGTINIKNMNWAREPNIKVDGRWAKINKPSQAIQSGDVIYVKILGEREAQGLDLSLEQEPEVQAGLINIHPATGNIKAMIGGYDYSQSKFNRAVQAIRQPGSAFKPIIYLTALKEGFTPASIILDSPVIFKERDETFDKWKPANYEQKFYGPTPMRTALAHSRNVVTIKLLQSVGIKKAIRMARSLGITSRLEPNLSIALGSSGLTLMELVSAYSVFPNQGYRNEPNTVRYIKNRNDEMIYTHQPKGDQVISSGLAYLITSLMESVVQNGTGSKVKVLKRPIAGKTGTTNNFIDAWFLGYTANSATGVWVGKDKDESLGVNETGSRAAIPIWLEYMKKTLEGTPVYNFPVSREVTFAKINEETGYAASYGDPKAKFESFLRTNLPQSPSQTDALTSENTF